MNAHHDRATGRCGMPPLVGLLRGRRDDGFDGGLATNKPLGGRDGLG
jgi:hypothetical protein